MIKRLLVVGIVAVLAVSAFGQSELSWFTTTLPANDPFGSALPGSVDGAVGALVQVVKTSTAVGGTTSPPEHLFPYRGANPYDPDSDGLTGGDTLAFFDWIGSTDGTDGSAEDALNTELAAVHQGCSLHHFAGQLFEEGKQAGAS